MTLREAVRVLSGGRGFRDGKRQTALEIVLTYCLADIGRESLEREPDPDRDPRPAIVIRDERGPVESDAAPLVNPLYANDRCICSDSRQAHIPDCNVSGCECKEFELAGSR